MDSFLPLDLGTNGSLIFRCIIMHGIGFQVRVHHSDKAMVIRYSSS